MRFQSVCSVGNWWFKLPVRFVKRESVVAGSIARKILAQRHGGAEEIVFGDFG